MNDTEEKDKEVEVVDYSTMFSFEIDDFINQIESLIDTIPIVMGMVEGRFKHSSEKFDEFKKEGKIELFDDNKKLSVKIEHFPEYKNLTKVLRSSKIAYQIIPRNFIVSLVSMYDAYLGKLIRLLYYIHPEKLNESERQFTFSELMEFEDLEDAREYMIEKEIESVLRKSHHDQIKWLENKLGITLRKDLIIYPSFIEVTERRNLFVHTDGRVSRQYLNNCEIHQVECDESISLDTILKAPPSYLDKAYRAIFEMGVKLGNVMWRKLLPNELAKADAHLNNLSYDLMFYGDFNLAKEILHFSTQNLKKHGSNDTKLTMDINHALVHYLLKEYAACNKILNKVDWSATNDKFQLAVSVLKKDYESAVKFMKRIGSTHDEVNPFSYMEWPLFDDFRLTETFKEAYKEIFEEEFKIVERKPKNFIRLMNNIQERAIQDEEE